MCISFNCYFELVRACFFKVKFVGILQFILFYRWYQIKITMRWEDSEYTSVGTPARVVQYEGTDFCWSCYFFFYRAK